MCLAPKAPPAAPEAPAPPPQAPIPVTPETAKPTTVKQQVTQRNALRQASKGPARLTIPLSTGGVESRPTNLSIGNN